MILVRHGVMILGEAISCKTNAFKVLSQTLGDLTTSQEFDEFNVIDILYEY